MDTFSVAEWLPTGRYRYVAKYISAYDAVKLFKERTESLDAISGAILRVIITDGGDCITTEWKHGEGVIYPPELATKLKDSI